ncbi:hypothetical protein CNMCM7691_003178 [Aspergillus felis]|uniref:Uncharacterized protein n=1 Tax=Aspergillus felis TaxID=1287682 RepID=A0A8H6V9U2_9EURO|nr:hypothetical protein CNMCM7691_003178 [Aspergillus felis]
MTLPNLYKKVTLTSYDKIRYRGEEPEGIGGASPFTMGLAALVARPHATLVRSLALCGDWPEARLEKDLRTGQVPDSSMILNVVVRAAVDRIIELESFSWELNTKMLETVYLGLEQRSKLTSLTIRFPSSRRPQPTIVVPPMPHLRSLKITHIDPLCYPDDISTLLWKSKRLSELKMQWSPRMRIEQECSVVLHDYFRKCIAAKQPLKLKKLALQNLYAHYTEDFNVAIDMTVLEDLTFLCGSSSNNLFDSSWPANPPAQLHFKSIREDCISRKHAEFLAHFTGLEKLYFVCASSNLPASVNRPSQSLTPAPLHPTIGLAALNTALEAGIRDIFLHTIILNHSATLRHLLLPSHWPLPASTIVRLAHASPQLEQLAFAVDPSGTDSLDLILSFFHKLAAVRLLVSTNPASSPLAGSDPSRPAMPAPEHTYNSFQSPANLSTLAQALAEFVELDDHTVACTLSEAFADQHLFRQLKIIGIGHKAWQLGGHFAVSIDGVVPVTEPLATMPTSPSWTSGIIDGTKHRGLDAGDQLILHAQDSVTALNITSTVMERGPAARQLAPRLGQRQQQVTLCPSARPSKKWGLCMDDADPCISRQTCKDAPRWKRRVKQVGWEVLQNWEIWALDSQDI